MASHEHGEPPAMLCIPTTTTEPKTTTMYHMYTFGSNKHKYVVHRVVLGWAMVLSTHTLVTYESFEFEKQPV